jgi:hypothetical protein
VLENVDREVPVWDAVADAVFVEVCEEVLVLVIVIVAVDEGLAVFVGVLDQEGEIEGPTPNPAWTKHTPGTEPIAVTAA